MLKMTTDLTTEPIGLEAVLKAVFPPEGLLRLVDASGGDRFFRRAGATGAWTSLTRAGTVGLSEFIARHATAHVRFSPTAWRAPSRHSPIAGVTCVWTAMTCRLETTPHQPSPRMLPDELEHIRARLTGAGWFPSVLLNDGDRLTALWALEHPLTNPAHVQWLLHRLAERLGGDRDLADPTTALIRVPGMSTDGLSPSPPVTVERFSRERRYTVAEIERMIERASVGRSASTGPHIEIGGAAHRDHWDARSGQDSRVAVLGV